MDRTKALTAGAIVLTVTGAVSALFLTVGAADNGTPPSATTEIVEYVDAAGNPLPAAQAGVTATPAPAEPAYVEEPADDESGEYPEDEEHEDDEHEDDEHEEHEQGEEEHDD